MRCHAIRFGIRHVDQIVSDVKAAGAAELLPFSEIFSVLIENLDSHVAAVGDKESSACIHRNVMRSSEFSRPSAKFAEGLYELAVLSEFRNA